MLAGGAKGKRILEIKKQNELGYELMSKRSAVTDFTENNLMDGPASTGNNQEMIQRRGTM